MSDLKTVLEGAAGEGIISPDQAARLLPYLSERNIDVGPAAATDFLSQPRDVDPPNALEDSEAPRFIRGFHDVLITIGIVVFLVALWGLTTYYGPIVAIVILAEILVRRQRLALPAVALTIALAQWIFTTVFLFVDPAANNHAVTVNLMLLALPFAPLFGIYYWRYRVPLALAMLLFSLLALLLSCIFYLVGLATGVPDVFSAYPVLSTYLIFASALGAFAVAMRFDLSDPARLTRRSDVAFWLHLVTAPALLYSTILLALRLKAGDSVVPIANAFSYADTLIVVAIVIIMMLIGMIIDRRAFVTSGLVSLGAAVGAILQQNNANFDKVSFLALLIVGLFVLLIGIGWPHLRRAVIRLLPASMQGRLPALR
jgi:hypothetical protein